jgi:hypothetical protein
VVLREALHFGLKSGQLLILGGFQPAQAPIEARRLTKLVLLGQHFGQSVVRLRIVGGEGD